MVLKELQILLKRLKGNENNFSICSVKHRYQCGRAGVRFAARSNWTQSCEQIATAPTFLQSCVGQALSGENEHTLRRGDGSRHSVHVSAHSISNNATACTYTRSQKNLIDLVLRIC